GLAGDPAVILDQLRQALPEMKRDKWIKRVQAHVAEWKSSIACLRSSEASPIRPERLCFELGKYLPENAILITDTGYSSQWTGTFTELEHSKQRYYRAAGSLGWGFPASLGAKFAAPDLPVVCFTGDGGFMYHMTEL